MLSDKRPRPSTSSHLAIQPLRDLARNFDIDIEPYLREYLHRNHRHESTITTIRHDDDEDDLDDIHREEEDAARFADAALKIQNSTGIYTRKVDYLHRVVYEAHESLHEFLSHNTNNSRNVKRRGGGGRDDEDIAMFRSADPDMEFILLDDVLPVDRSCHKIDLRNHNNHSRNDATTTDHGDAAGDTTHNNNNNVTLLSLGGIMSAARNNDTFLSRHSVDTSRETASRMLLQTLNGGANHNYNNNATTTGCGGGSAMYRLLNADVDSDGALVMPGAKKGVFVNGELMSPLQGCGIGGSGGDGEEKEENVQIFPGGMSPDNDDAAEFGGGYNDGNYDDEFGGDDGVGFELHDGHMDEPPTEIAETTEPSRVKEKETTTKRDDPWEALDPHRPSQDRIKPLKVGVTVRLPPGLDRPSACVTGSRTRANVDKGKDATTTTLERQMMQDVADVWQVSPFVTDRSDPMNQNNDDYQDEKDDNTNSKSDMDWMFRINEGIYGEEFAYVADRYAKHYDAIARQKRRREREGEALLPDHDPMNGEVDQQCHDYEDYGGGFDYGDDDDDSYGNYDGADLDRPENDDRGNCSNVDFAAIDDVFASAGLNHNNAGDDDDYDRSRMSFEELCRAHLRKFAKSAEVYAAETQLTKRVGAWQDGLAPILEEQATRPEFDIHDLGRQILESVEDKLSTKKRTATGEKKLDAPSSGLDDKSNIVGFRQLSKDKEEYEVCRLFLSTLMLCNCGNVIVHDGNDVSSTESLQIELLNSKFEAIMDDFLAPSVQEDNGLPGTKSNMSREDDDSCCGLE